MSKAKIGCGAQARLIRAGWIVALRYGDNNIIAASETHKAARLAALVREGELRRQYARNMPRARPS